MGEFVGEVLRSEETEAEGVFPASNRLRAWAADLAHGSGHAGFVAGSDTARALARCFVRAPATCVTCPERVMTGPDVGSAARGCASGTLRWP